MDHGLDSYLYAVVVYEIELMTGSLVKWSENRKYFKVSHNMNNKKKFTIQKIKLQGLSNGRNFNKENFVTVPAIESRLSYLRPKIQ